VPFTPYHFGPNGFIGLVFRKWLDLPVLVLANVVVDFEVLVIGLFQFGHPYHRYCHTFLIGAGVGLLWGVAAYPLRHLFKRLMQIFRIPYETSLRKMVISGILGVWLHVLFDGIYHWDIRPFWPSRINPLYKMLIPLTRRRMDQNQLEAVCLAFFVAAFIVYVIILMLSYRSKANQIDEKGHN
jgi:hypothetical protein